MRNKLYILTALALALTMMPGCRHKALSPEEQAVADSLATADSIARAEAERIASRRVENLPEEPVFDIITSEGTIKVRLYSATPRHRVNFATIALSGGYNGTKFHRVCENFIIQGGDPNSKDEYKKDIWGKGGTERMVPAEIVEELTHKKGALVAARVGDDANPMRDSNGYQFYLVVNPVACAHLDGHDTVFGETVEGMGVIDRIARAQVDQNDCPTQNIRIISVKLDDELNKPVEKAEEQTAEESADDSEESMEEPSMTAKERRAARKQARREKKIQEPEDEAEEE